MTPMRHVLIAAVLLLGAPAAHAAPDEPRHKFNSFDAGLEQLPPEKAEAFRKTMAKAHHDNEPLMAQGRKLRAQLRDIMTAPTFDQEMYMAKAKHMQELRDAIHLHTTEAFASALGTLSPEERKKLVEGMHKANQQAGKDIAGADVQ